MEEYVYILKKNKLFQGFSNQEIVSLLQCLSARVVFYKKDQPILHLGDQLQSVGIVLQGKIKIQREAYDGTVSIIEEMHQGALFGEALVSAKVVHAPISIWTMAEVKILYIDYGKIVTTCSSACIFHTNLIKNMLQVMAEKLLLLNQKINILQKPSIREKILCFLEGYQKNTEQDSFLIGLNRSEMAEYLCVNRSALSRELCKMRDEGVIQFKGNCFTLLKK